MNYIKHLTGFFDKVTNDKLLNPTHISLYIALFQFWNCNRFKNPISISRDEVMRISKISSKATYHKCLRELHTNGYIKYEPSYNPFKGSHVFLFNFGDSLKPMTKSEKLAGTNFEPVSKQVADKSQTGSETGAELVTEQAVVPYINNTNITNNQNNSNSLNLDEPEKKNTDLNFDLNNEFNLKEKGSAEKEMLSTSADSYKNQTEVGKQKVFNSLPQTNELIPSVEEILKYFHEQNFPEIEANKFFNYFKSVGWLVGGKTQMVDWQAAARNWMLNALKFTTNERTDKSKHFDTTSGKNYSEPL